MHLGAYAGAAEFHSVHFPVPKLANCKVVKDAGLQLSNPLTSSMNHLQEAYLSPLRKTRCGLQTHQGAKLTPMSKLTENTLPCGIWILYLCKRQLLVNHKHSKNSPGKVKRLKSQMQVVWKEEFFVALCVPLLLHQSMVPRKTLNE